MIFDCHTHLADTNHVYGSFLSDGRKAWGEDYKVACSPTMHREAMKQCDGAIVLALDAPNIGYFTPNEFVYEYVQTNPTRLFGFASVDPNRENPDKILEHAIKNYKLKGLKLAPIYQAFHPHDYKADLLYKKANELDIPILWHQGASFVHNGYFYESNPMLLDEVSRSYPDLKMVVAHLGHPWYAETVCLIRKNHNMYADISALGSRPWQMYNAILCAYEYGVTHKLLFGTDLPVFDVNTTIQALRNINKIIEGTNMTRIPEKVIEDIIHRDTPGILGLT